MKYINEILTNETNRYRLNGKTKRCINTMSRKKMSLSKFLEEMDISRGAGYRWVMRYVDDLQEKGLLEVKKRGVVKRIFILDPKGVVDYFKEKGIYFKDD